jgi:hypothetical protein
VIVLVLAALFGALVFAVTRFGFRQDWRWALFAALVGFGLVLVYFVPIQTHMIKSDMPRPK